MISSFLYISIQAKSFHLVCLKISPPRDAIPTAPGRRDTGLRNRGRDARNEHRRVFAVWLRTHCHALTGGRIFLRALREEQVGVERRERPRDTARRIERAKGGRKRNRKTPRKDGRGWLVGGNPRAPYIHVHARIRAHVHTVDTAKRRPLGARNLAREATPRSCSNLAEQVPVGERASEQVTLAGRR